MIYTQEWQNNINNHYLTVIGNNISSILKYLTHITLYYNGL